MTTAQQSANIAQLNKANAAGGVIAAPSAQTPTQVSAAVSKGISNPKDAPGYVPGTLPGDKVNPATPASTAQPSPTNVNATPSTGASQELSPTDQAPQGLVDQLGQAQSLADELKAKYTQAHADLTKSGVNPPSSQGSANAGVKSALDSQPKTQPAPEIPASVETATNPATNPLVDTQLQTLREFLSPPAQRQALTDAMSQLKTDKSELGGLKTELMNVKRIMAGSQQDIMDEVTKAGGTISASLLSNMTIARNRALVTQGQNLQDQIQSVQDMVATDTTLVGDEKQIASEQFSQNMSLLNFAQTNYNNQMNATRDMYKTLIADNPQGLYDSLQKDPVMAQRFQTITGLNTDSLKGIISTHQLDITNKQLQNAKLTQELTQNTPGTPAFNKNQEKLEQQYRTILTKELSNRSGGLGLQDAKVNQAIHLKVLADSYKDSKGNYNVPKAQYAELVMGLANLLSPSGQTSEGDRAELRSKTASGDLKGALQYITGSPQNGNTQQIIKNLVDSIDRQGGVAEDLRNQGVLFLHGLVPTDLEQSRVDALEKNSLASYKNYNQDKSVDHPQGTSTSFNGHTYVSDGKQWVLQK